MTLRDSLGVPQEPNYEEPILKDIYGDYIYENSTVYINADGIVLKENLKKYSNEYVEDLTAGEANEELRESMLPSQYSETIKEALLTWIEENGYAKYFKLQAHNGGDVVESRRNY